MDMIFNLFQVDELNRVHLFGFTFYMDDLIIVLLLLFFYFELILPARVAGNFFVLCQFEMCLFV